MDKHTLTPEQIDWLKANMREHNGKRCNDWAYTSNSISMIEELVKLGLMKNKSGAFILSTPSDPPETINLFGNIVPIETMVSLYELTNQGKDIFNVDG